jgi:hypothetical protein
MFRLPVLIPIEEGDLATLPGPIRRPESAASSSFPVSKIFTDLQAYTVRLIGNRWTELNPCFPIFFKKGQIGLISGFKPFHDSGFYFSLDFAGDTHYKGAVRDLHARADYTSCSDDAIITDLAIIEYGGVTTDQGVVPDLFSM